MSRPLSHLHVVPKAAAIPSEDAALPIDERAPMSLERTFRLYSPYVAAVALRLLGRDAEVDDVVQDVFLAGHHGLGRLRDPDAVKGWLATVTVRVARRRLWARRVRAFVGLDDAPDYAEVASSEASPEQRALISAVYRVLDALPVEQRIAWALRHLDGEELTAVAAACGCSLATAKRRIGAAHHAIERELDHG